MLHAPQQLCYAGMLSPNHAYTLFAQNLCRYTSCHAVLGFVLPIHAAQKASRQHIQFRFRVRPFPALLKQTVVANDYASLPHHAHALLQTKIAKISTVYS
jgi:hypothetical protein